MAGPLSPFPADLARRLSLSQQPGDLQTYGRDWTRKQSPAPLAVAFPRHPEEVAEALAFCQREGIAVVPSGGRTGLAGGAVAAQGELVLSLEKLAWLEAVDPVGATLRVGAGAVTESVHRHCAPHALTWPIDLASKGSCQIGGNLATNAGGLRVVRYGSTRHWVLALQVALMDGRLFQVGGELYKNNVGPDLGQLLIGSEGILGVITAACLRLTPLPRDTLVMLLGLDHLEAALELLQEFRQRGAGQLQAFEFFDRACLEVVCQMRSLRPPLAGEMATFVLLEVEGETADSLEAWLGLQLERGLVKDGVLVSSPRDKARLWAYRESISEALARRGLLHKNDLAVPVRRLAELLTRLRSDLEPDYPGCFYLFGHVADGNLHLNVMKPPEMPAEAFWQACQKADEGLYRLIQELGGSVSAEHGIGTLKREALLATRGEVEVEVLRSLKRALDPHGLLNPGKVLGPATSR